MKTVVFDFDGTLSYRDSMTELFNEQMKGVKMIYRVYYIFLKVLSKLQITTVRFEKEQMIKLLFHSNSEYFAEACRELAERFELNQVFPIVQKHIDNGDRVIVLSASPVYFLDVVFAGMNVELIGTTFQEADGRIIGIECHPFYYEKVECLKQIGVLEIDEMYYDSKWDEVLIPMSKLNHKIKNF